MNTGDTVLYDCNSALLPGQRTLFDVFDLEVFLARPRRSIAFNQCNDSYIATYRDPSLTMECV